MEEFFSQLFNSNSNSGPTERRSRSFSSRVKPKPPSPSNNHSGSSVHSATSFRGSVPTSSSSSSSSSTATGPSTSSSTSSTSTASASIRSFFQDQKTTPCLECGLSFHSQQPICSICYKRISLCSSCSRGLLRGSREHSDFVCGRCFMFDVIHTKAWDQLEYASIRELRDYFADRSAYQPESFTLEKYRYIQAIQAFHHNTATTTSSSPSTSSASVTSSSAPLDMNPAGSISPTAYSFSPNAAQPYGSAPEVVSASNPPHSSFPSPPGPSAATSEPLLPKPDLWSLSVRELKDILQKSGISTEHCFEKTDLIEALERFLKTANNSIILSLFPNLAPFLPPSPVANIDDQFLCKICFDQPIETCFLECGHMVSCEKCSQTFQKSQAQKSSLTCLVCRRSVTRVIRVYL